MMRYLSLLILTFFFFQLTAQHTDVLKFEEQTFDFGTVKEEAGPITHEFTFTNTGDKPVKISNVSASCGCTTPGWTKEAVAPGEKGFVKAQYNPFNRPGYFNKNLTVYIEGGKEIKLYIKGNVIPKPKSIEEQLPAANGNIRTKFKSFNMGKVLTSENPTAKEFEIYNSGEKPIVITSVKHPEHISLTYPDTLLPGKTEQMIITYSGKDKNDLGFFSESIVLVTDDQNDMEKEYTVYTNVEEYFPPLSVEEWDRSPRLSFGEQVYDFGRTEEGEKVETEFEFTNNGKSTLNIRKVDSNCSCLKVELTKNDLTPGESAKIKAILSTDGRRGNQQKAITIYSNDPSAPVQRLTVKGYVKGD